MEEGDPLRCAGGMTRLLYLRSLLVDHSRNGYRQLISLLHLLPWAGLVLSASWRLQCPCRVRSGAPPASKNATMATFEVKKGPTTRTHTHTNSHTQPPLSHTKLDTDEKEIEKESWSHIFRVRGLISLPPGHSGTHTQARDSKRN